MKTLALRKAPANVVGLVGLVENMPDGKAQRPGDVVRSMKGDTIEVINTDAEGRLVLADVLWYAQERFKPRGMIDLATLTGAIIIALGHEKAGVFSNDDALANAFLAAAEAEGEGAWRMPLAPAYDKALKSRIADIANVGGRPAGSITAAQFLQRFVKAGHALGASRHRRGRLCQQGRRARAEGRDRLGGAGARPADPGQATRAKALAEVLFYHLTSSPLEASLPEMLERSAGARLAGGAALRLGGGDRRARRDALDLSRRRLPAARHGRDGQAARQPIYLTLGEENPNDANVLMLVDGARASLPEMAAFERTCLIFDGQRRAGGGGGAGRLAGGHGGRAAGEILGAGAGEVGAEGGERVAG